MIINFDPKDISMDNSLKVPLIKYHGEGAGGEVTLARVKLKMRKII